MALALGANGVVGYPRKYLGLTQEKMTSSAKKTNIVMAEIQPNPLSLLRVPCSCNVARGGAAHERRGPAATTAQRVAPGALGLWRTTALAS